jgi:single-stranded-DNA-specific exonuclease
MMTPIINIDAELRLSEINDVFYKILSQMEPFGPDNPQPVFIARGVRDAGSSRIVKQNHIRFVVRQDNITMSGIGFNLATKFPVMDNGQPFDMAFMIDENEWQGNRTLQVRVVDIKFAD